MVAKNSKINVQGVDISISNFHQQDYICLTDMVKAKDGDFTISDWLRNRDTIEFLGTWEGMFNSNFNYGEFTIIKNESGGRAYRISIKDWVEKTNAVGITSKSGRYGGTYAHVDIAFNFGMWISPMFQLYIIKEYQRLKEVENNQYNLDWNVRRVLAKVNYKVHTEAIKNHIIPKLSLSQKKDWIYASEADVYNIVVFGCTAKQWKEANPERVLKGENIRDMASINELTILSTLEGINAVYIKQDIDKKERMRLLYNITQEQRKVLDKVDVLNSIQKLTESTYVNEFQKKTEEKLSSHNSSLKTALDNNTNEEMK